MNGTDIKDIRDSRIAFAQAGSETNDIIAGDKYVVQNYITEQKNIRQSAPQMAAMPYKFLASYEIADHDIFFGRDAAIQELLGMVPRYQTLVINGRSGAGKTSLLHAGLIPRLTDMGYQYLSFRDYSDPLSQLREYAAQHERLTTVAESFSLRGLLKAMSSGFDGAHQPQPVTVIFDQFERFFVNVPPIARAAFIQEVKACLHSGLSSADAHLLFAMREDFFGVFVSEFEAQMETFLNDAARLNLRPLRPEEARDAILLPIKNLPTRIGYDLNFVDDVLLPALLNEGGDGGGAVACGRIDPPHVQIVCNQLYQAARDRYAAQLAQGGMAQIDRQLYKDLGETRGILRSYLDDVLDRAAQHESGQRDVLRSMLKVMVESTGTRKFVALSDLHRGLPDVAAGQLEQHLRRLQGSRVLETRVSGGDTHYSLSHEVLVDKVQSWFDERELQRKKAQETLARGLAEWQSTRALLNEKQVSNIRQWLSGDELDEEAEGLLDASQQAYEERRRKEAEQERRIKRSRAAFQMALVIGFVIAVALSAIAFWQQRLAERRSLISTAQTLVMMANELTREGEREHAALLVYQADHISKNNQGEIDDRIETALRQIFLDRETPLKNMLKNICQTVTRNLTQEEWQQTIGHSGVPYEACSNLPASAAGANFRVRLRSTPITTTEVQELSLNLERWGYLVTKFTNDFEDRGNVIVDHASGLTWQKAGSEKPLTYEGAQQYVKQRNQERFAGYNDWRLPTIEELASLLEPEPQAHSFFRLDGDAFRRLKADDDPVPDKVLEHLVSLQDRKIQEETDFVNELRKTIEEKAMAQHQTRIIEQARTENKLYIAPLFDSEGWWIWSADIYLTKGKHLAESAWYVGFSNGHANWSSTENDSWVRCVRP